MGSVYLGLKRYGLILAGLLLVALLVVTPADALEWTTRTVDSSGDVGRYTSLALDNNGYPHISYRDATKSDLKYAAWNGTAWTNQTVDSVGSVGEYTSLALNSSGYPCISYYDATNSNLKYAAWNGTAWTNQTVDSVGDVGWYTSLALDNNGYPRISYHDTTNGDLKYAAWSGTAWSTQTIDSVGSVGAHSSLSLNSSDFPCISYYDGTNTDLKYAAWSGSVWTIQTVDSGVSVVGTYTSLALDSSGNPRISYYDGTNTDLKYAAWSGTAWSTQTIDSTGDVGKYTSLALDHSGNPCISYYDGTNTDLKYAAWSGTAWSTQTIDSVGSVGLYTSLALDSSDNPGISYYDTTKWDLKYTKGVAVNAGFTAAPTSGASPLAVSFSDTSTGTPTAWTWYFGNGGVSAIQSPVHTYTTAGTYTVYLTAKDSFTSNTTVQIGYITVTDSGSSAVVSGFTGSPMSGTAPLTVTFTDTSTNTPSSWNWNFGSYSVADGGVSTVRNPSHTYASAGTYTVTLNAQNANGGDTSARTGYITVSSTGGDSGSGSGSGSSGSSSSGGSDSDSGGSSPSSGSGSYGTVNANVGGGSAVDTVTVTGTGVNGVIVTGRQQDTLPPGVPPVDPNAYQYIEITPARFGSITGATISFAVPVSWLEEHGLTTGDVSMNRYHEGAWTSLPTTFFGVNNGVASYSAQSPGFSLFAITPKKNGAQAGTASASCPVIQPASCPVCPGPVAGSLLASSGAPAVCETAAPQAPAVPDTGSPLTTGAIIGVSGIGLISGGMLVRRWWIRRQNPALFRQYD
ncbi:MAG: PKD domain-containing protein [Methanoregula sp.]|nr:PKD domain-containing protein [Methanoregula sp.]